MIDIYEFCGYSAGALFASSLIPQIYKSCKTKKLDDISFGWQFIVILALMMSLIYGIHEKLAPIYISSSVELAFMVLLVIMKIVYKDYSILTESDIENP